MVELTASVAPAAAASGRRLRLAVVVAVAAAWAAAFAAQLSGAAAVLHHDRLLAHGLPHLSAIVVFILAWQVMVAAMMVPSSLPLVRLFATASAGAPRPVAAMAAFLSAYALVWTAFGTAACAFDLGVHSAVNASPWLRAHDWWIGGSVLALAGAFQFTALKDACLRQCRHPASFLVRHYERGPRAAFTLGVRHGAFCLGCCWAIMLVAFAIGVTSLIWMAALTALMVFEKTHHLGARTVPLTGVALLGGASVVLLYSAAAAGALG